MTTHFFERYRQSLNLRKDLKDIFVSTTDDKNQLKVLDGYRAIAVLLVLLLHCVVGITKLLDTSQITEYIASLPGWLNFAWQARGSDMIFILCGLLVTLSLLNEYKRSDTIDFKRFYKYRIIRIYPLFLLALGLYLLADSDRYIYLLSNMLFMTNFSDEQKNIIPVGWSLNIQMQFYAFLPLLVLLILKVKTNLNMASTCFLILVATASIFSLRYFAAVEDPSFIKTPFYEFFNDKSDYEGIYGNALYYNLSTRIGPFMLGTLVAFVFHFKQAFFEKSALVTNGCLLLGITLIFVTTNTAIHNRYDDFYLPFDSTANLILLVTNKYLFSIGMGLFILSTMLPTKLTSYASALLSLPIWRPFAKLIYPIYLFHFPFIIIAAVIVFQTTHKEEIISASTVQVLSIFLLASIMSAAFAIIPHLFIEKPLIAMSKNKNVRNRL